MIDARGYTMGSLWLMVIPCYIYIYTMLELIELPLAEAIVLLGWDLRVEGLGDFDLSQKWLVVSWLTIPII